MSVILLITGALGVSGTFAFLTASDKQENLLAAGHNTTTIEEEFPKPPTVPVTENPEYTKTVRAANRTSAENGFGVDCYVRIMLSYSNSDIGRAVTLQGLNTQEWVYHEDDGYYYYTGVLKEGQQTPPLFTGFRIDSGKVEDAWKRWIDEFSIEIYEESVQAEGFSDYQSAWSYFTKPVSRGGKE